MAALHVWIDDVGAAIRRLARHPRHTLLAMGTLVLGLATSTAVFSYVSAYSRAFPGARAEPLDQIWRATDDGPWNALSWPDFHDLQALDPAGLEVTGVGAGSFAASVRRGDEAGVAYGQSVAGGFFSVLDVEMAAGRGFSPDDDAPGAPPTTVLAHDYWVSHYGSDPAAVGETILLNNEAYVIVGVAGPAFLGADAAFRPQFYLPLEQYLRVYRPGDSTRGNREVGVVIPILRRSGGREAAGAALVSFAAALDAEAPLAGGPRRFVLEPATWIGPATRDAEATTARVLMAAAALLLLLACANVANLVLSTGASRTSEMALRRAVGASRGRLVGQSLLESLLVAGGAGVIAVLLAGPAGLRLSSYFARPSVWGANVAREVVVSPRVLAFACGMALLTGVVTGLLPALRVSSRDPAESMGAGGGRSVTEGSRRPWRPGTRSILVGGQIALCVVLLFVAGLVLRTLQATSRVDPGFDTERTIASYVSTSSMGVPIAERHRFYDDLRRRLVELPWVADATVAENAPLSGHPRLDLLPPEGSDPVAATVARVWPGYVELLEMEVVRGRAFLPTDTLASAGVVLVNETLARLVVGDGDPLGRALRVPESEGSPEQGFEIVGVVRDVRQVALLEEPGPVAYFSLPQVYSRPGNAVVVKVRGDPTAAVTALEGAFRDVDTRLAILNVLSYGDVVAGFLYSQRMNAELFTLIAVLGLLLAATGVFAVVTLAVAARRREIGIRRAVGGDWLDITRVVAGSVGLAALVGLAVGLAGAFAATRVVGGLLWGLSPTDPVSMGVAGGVLLVGVVLAAAVPVGRAVRGDPVAVLRGE